jgi:hypothetical protein
MEMISLKKLEEAVNICTKEATNENDGCAPVKIQIGAVNKESHHIKHDVLIISKCPPRIVTKLLNAGFYLSTADEYRTKGILVENTNFDD